METTRANIQAAERERVNSLEMRSLVDRVLQQVADDISKQVANTNLALEHRIEEVRSARNKLADHHAKVTEEEKKMEDTIAGLERAIESKRKPLELAESRIVTRKQRPNIELCRDPAQYRLVEEVEELQRCISSLEAQLEAANTQLRALTRKRLQLEDEIALRDHALFIDDVECATLRKSIKVDRF
jgi:tektin-1